MKLVYFTGRGLAETSRILFAYGGEEYEDFRYPLDVIDFATHNMVKEEFDKDKESGLLVKSMNKLPYLEVDGNNVICQSKSIERFLGRRFNLMGDSETEHARIDAITECDRDLKDLYQGVRKDEDKETANIEWFTVTLVDKLKLLELQLSDDYCVGLRTSLADIVLFTFITQFFDNKEASLNATLATPKIRKIVDNVSSNDNIRKWLNTRPDTVF
jgi:glutathione S-transferase